MARVAASSAEILGMALQAGAPALAFHCLAIKMSEC
jgi:hypothetical protein